MEKRKWKILIPALAAFALAAALCLSGGTPDSIGPEAVGTPAVSAVSQQAPDSSSAQAESTAAPTPPEAADGETSASPVSEPETGDPDGGAAETAPAPEETPLSPEAPAGGGSCTISISCATILDNLELCDPDKVELVPEDGWILEPVTVPFSPGESVFDVLLRTCRQRKIHLEYEDTPIYNSAYIEGIHNLYEFDVGELSGWMYTVNGWFPNYGCSRYQLQDGDVVCWVYTCDLGGDVGGGYSTDGGPGEG